MDQAEQLRNIVKQQSIKKQRENKQAKDTRVITITSGKGGVGKTSIAVNMAIQFSKMGKKVLVLDADFGLANIEVMFGVVPRYHLGDLIFKDKEIYDIITEGPMEIGFISGGSGIQELVNMSKDELASLIRKLSELDELADVILIDTGAGISNTVLEFVMSSPEVLLVSTPEPTSITDAYALLKALNRNQDFYGDYTTIKMVTNRVNSLEEGRELYNKLNLVVHKFLEIDLEYLGAIPQDISIQKSVMQQKPTSLLYPKAISTKAFEDLSNLLYDIHVEQNIPKPGIAALFTNLIRKK